MSFLKGYTPYNKGKKLPPHSEETKEKIRKSLTGKKHTKERILKNSESHKGKKYSQKRNSKISQTLSGVATRGYGWKASEETKLKQSLAHRGSKSPFWKGGKMAEYPEGEIIRKSDAYKLWRKTCLLRDNFTCQKTRQRGGRLVVHHINNFADFPELRLLVDNGITLSEKAHKEFHHKYGVKNNTREQIIEFLNEK